MSLFGISNPDNVAIVLHIHPNYSQQVPYSDAFSIAVSDVMAAANIIELFNNLDLRSPEIMFDRRACRELDPPSVEKKTFISIGLFSNELSQLLSDKEIGLFRIVIDEDPDNLEILLAPIVGGKVEIDKSHWRRRRPDHFKRSKDEDTNCIIDFSLVSKSHISNNTVFIFGGISASGTKLLGNYLLNNWEKIITWEDPVTRDKVKHHSFAGVFSFNRPLEESYTEESNEHPEPNQVRILV